MVQPYVDGELGLRDAERVRRHLDGCWGCSGDSQVFRQIKHSLSRVGDRMPPQVTAARLRRWAQSLEN